MELLVLAATWMGLALAIGAIGKAHGVGFWIGFGLSLLLTPVAGMTMAVLLAKSGRRAPTRTALRAVGDRKCPFCAKRVESDAVECRSCGHRLRLPTAAPLAVGRWLWVVR